MNDLIKANNSGKIPEGNLDSFIQNYGFSLYKDLPLSEIDALIFCQFGYLHYDKILPTGYESKSFMEIFDQAELKQYKDLYDLNGMFPSIPASFSNAAHTERYKNVHISLFEKEREAEKTDFDNQIQFASLTYVIPETKQICVVFRGTDEYLTGWNEDFNLMLSDDKPIPAQTKALTQLKKALMQYPDYSVSVAGHSKGGNLAMYACANLEDHDKARITDIYCFDSPGFSRKKLETKGFRDISHKLRIFVPDTSVVGMLFYHYPTSQDEYKKTTVVKSSALLLNQHALLSWIIDGSHFYTVPEFSLGSKYIYETVNEFIANTKPEQRELVIDLVFETLYATGQQTLGGMVGTNEISKESIKENSLEILKTSSKSLIKSSIAGTKTGWAFIKNDDTRKLLLQLPLLFGKTNIDQVNERIVDKAITNIEDKVSESLSFLKKFLRTIFSFYKRIVVTTVVSYKNLNQRERLLLSASTLGLFGVHRFQSGKKLSGCLKLALLGFIGFMLILTLLWWPLIILDIPLICIAIVWYLLDLMLIIIRGKI